MRARSAASLRAAYAERLTAHAKTPGSPDSTASSVLSATSSSSPAPILTAESASSALRPSARLPKKGSMSVTDGRVSGAAAPIASMTAGTLPAGSRALHRYPCAVSRRHLTRAGLAVAVLACAGAAPAPAPAQTPPAAYDAGEADPGGDPAAAIKLPPRKRLFGFSGNAFLHTGRGGVLDLGLKAPDVAARGIAIGANSARMEIPWPAVEPRQGAIDYAVLRRFRRYARAFRKTGGKVVVLLNGAPGWASVVPGDPSTSVAKTQTAVDGWAAYAGLVARFFKRTAAAFEVGNEPNATFSFKPGPPDPEHYLTLLRRAGAAVRAAAPRVPVITGGLAANLPYDPRVMSPQNFLKALYAEGMTPDDYDGLSIHAYPRIIDGVPQLDSGPFAMAFQDFRAGYEWRDPRAKVWLTETGVSTTGPEAATWEQQAFAVNTLLRKTLSMPKVRGVYLHTQFDVPDREPESIEHGWGLQIAENGRIVPKASYCYMGILLRAALPLAGC